MSKKNLGSSIDDFLKQEGIFEDAQAQAVKEVVAWQLAAAMKEKKISKNFCHATLWVFGLAEKSGERWLSRLRTLLASRFAFHRPFL